MIPFDPIPAVSIRSAQRPGLLPVTGKWDANQSNLLYWAGMVEAGSEHPLARSILAEAEHLGNFPAAKDFETCTGRGVEATYQGRRVGVGSLEFMEALDVPVNRVTGETLAGLKSEGKTAVLVSVDGRVAGGMLIHEESVLIVILNGMRLLRD